jgi:transcriptional regulator with XRE-family HTH domain
MNQQQTAALVRRLRRRMGLTQEQFAQEVGVTFSTINQWENGHRCPQPYLQKRLSELEGDVTRRTAAKTKGRRKSSRGRRG